MNKFKQFIENYKSILTLKKTYNNTLNIKRYTLIYIITFLTMGIIFTIFYPSDTITENLGYVVMSIITVFLGSFLIALFDAEETFQKTYKLSYSIKTVLFFKGLEKATLFLIIISLLLNKYFQLLAPTYLVVLSYLITIVLSIVVLIVNLYLKDNYAMTKSIISDAISIYLFFIIISKLIYIEQIFYAFLIYSFLMLGLIYLRLILLTYTKFTFSKLKAIKVLFFTILFVIFFNIYNKYDHNVMGKPIIKRTISLDMSQPGGNAYNSIVYDNKIYVLNRYLFVYDLETGGSEIMYEEVIPSMDTNMVLYDNAIHFKYQASGEEDLRYGFINENNELVEEVIESSCQVEDYMEFYSYRPIPKCLGSKDIYLTEDIYYSIEANRERSLISTISTWEIYLHPFTNLAYDNYVLAKLNVGQSFFNSTLKIIDVEMSGETTRQHLKIPKDTRTIKLMDIENDLMTFGYTDSSFHSTRSTDYIMTYDANGMLLEYLDIYHPYIDYDTDDENIYLITIGDSETLAYKIYVLDKEHFVTFVMPKYSIRSEEVSLIPSFDREEKVNLTLEIIFSVMVISIIVIPSIRPIDEKNFRRKNI